MPSPKMLNIGCGTTHHPDWINLDVSSSDPSVLPVDINKGLPFSSDSITVCYSSHLLEHLDKVGARYFVAECVRVLNSGGVIRLAVPDLENIAREYLRVLDLVLAGDKTRKSDYDWIMLELYDQTFRNHSGGEMATYLFDEHLPNEKYVIARCGMEAEKLIKFGRQRKTQADSGTIGQKVSWLSKAYRLIRDSNQRRETFLKFFLKDEYDALQIGRFRKGGEVHQWMYDRFSLACLLEQAGFVDVKICVASESRIPEYEKYALDALNGVVRKPDSIFIEASKP